MRRVHTGSCSLSHVSTSRLGCTTRSFTCHPSVQALPCRHRCRIVCAVKERVEDVAEEKARRKPDMNAAVTTAVVDAVVKDKKRRRAVLDGDASAEEGEVANGSEPSTSGSKGDLRKQSQAGPASRLGAPKVQARAERMRAAKARATQAAVKVAPKNVQVAPIRGKKGTEAKPTSVEDFNPYTLGRRSRALLDTVWNQFTKLSSPGRVTVSSEQLDMSRISGDAGEFETPQAAVTGVLIIGATGRTGRIVVRKLLLRGYPVTALVRPDSAGKEALPEAVKVIEGDVGDYKACRQAVQGIDKVVYCADARTQLTGDVKRVSEDGILTLAKALQDERNEGITPPYNKVFHGIQPHPTAKKLIAGGHQSDSQVKRKTRWNTWKVLHCGPPAELERQNATRAKRYMPKIQDRVELWINKRNNLIFQGKLYSQRAYCLAGVDINMDNEGLTDTVGLVIRVKGDGQVYNAVLTTESGESWAARFSTNGRFQNVRIPYSAFRRAGGPQPAPGVTQLDPATARKLLFRYEYRGRQTRKQMTNDLEGLSDSKDRQFKLEINRVQALPSGTETDFILLSCAGTSAEEKDPSVLEKLLSFKRRGEAVLRQSGLGYTIVRPGPMIEEPGGYKALVFDQGDRIQQSISRADVADVCLKSLHEEGARNKTFEVCHEYTPETGLEMYELVAHLPNKANSYLGPALATLESNT